MKSVAISVALLTFLGGCSGRDSVVPVSNTARAMAAWGKPEEAGLRPQMCLEYSSPAERLTNQKASVGVPIAPDKQITASYESSQSLAQIYTVSEIMQFGHAALYRLCEAAANGKITRQEYNTLFEQTLSNMHSLLELQAMQAGYNSYLRSTELLARLNMTREELCRASASSSATSNDEKTKLRQAMEGLERELKTSPMAPLIPNFPTENEFLDADKWRNEAANFRTATPSTTTKKGEGQESTEKTELRRTCDSIAKLKKRYPETVLSCTIVEVPEACNGL